MNFIDLRPEDAFIDGYKPTCTIQQGNPHLKPWLDRLLDAGYPYLYPHNVLGDGYIFFHTEDDKYDYLRRMDGVEINSTEYVRKLGAVLGFPSNSVEFFTHVWEMDQKGVNTDHLDRETVGVNMSGIMFSAHSPHLIDDISWMWRTYDHPKAKELPTIFDTMGGEISLIHGDYANLARLAGKLNLKLVTQK